MKTVLCLTIMVVMGLLSVNCSNTAGGNKDGDKGNKVQKLVQYTYTHQNGSMYIETPEYTGCTDCDISLSQNENGEWVLVGKKVKTIEDEPHYVTDSIIVNDTVAQRVLDIVNECKLYNVKDQIEKNEKYLVYDAGSWNTSIMVDSLDIYISFGDGDVPKKKSDRPYLKGMHELAGYLKSLLPE